jgi:hypothetical protein
VEYDESAGPNVPGKLAQHVSCVSLKQEYVPTDNSIEGFPEGHRGRIAFTKRYVPGRPLFGSSPGRDNSCWSSVNADDRAFFTGQICSQERDVAGTRAYIKDSHPGDDAGIDEELSGDRF